MKDISKDWVSIRRAAIEFAIGFFICLLVTGLLFFEITVLGSTCGEDSAVEGVQVLLLVATALVFLKEAVARPDRVGGLSLITGFVLSMAIRELDWWTDQIQGFSWSYLVALVVGISVWIAWRNWATTPRGLAAFAESRACAIMMVGLLCVLVFSRLFGSKYIWYNLYDLERVRVLKNVVEEGLELFGMALMLTAGIMFRIESRLPTESAGGSCSEEKG